MDFTPEISFSFWRNLIVWNVFVLQIHQKLFLWTSIFNHNLFWLIFCSSVFQQTYWKNVKVTNSSTAGLEKSNFHSLYAYHNSIKYPQIIFFIVLSSFTWCNGLSLHCLQMPQINQAIFQSGICCPELGRGYFSKSLFCI